MRLTSRLLSFLNRVFDKDPRAFLALRLSYDGKMTWTVADAVLTTQVAGGSGGPLSVDLTQYTLGGLVAFLVTRPGYSVPYWDSSLNSVLGARVLLDGSGDPSQSNGDHLYAYTNVLFSWLEPVARELQTASDQIAQALAQLNTRTASDMWLDEWGAYYGVPREAGERDASYGPRIIAEVLRPRGNNVAIEAAIKAYTGQQTSVTDVIQWTPTTPLFNGAYNFDGSKTYNAHSSPIYGLFDVDYGYDLLDGTDFNSFANTVRALIERLRDAGTHLRSLTLTASQISDSVAEPVDSFDSGVVSMQASDTVAAVQSDDIAVALTLAQLADSVSTPADACGFVLQWGTLYDGSRSYDGSINFIGGGATAETL